MEYTFDFRDITDPDELAQVSYDKFVGMVEDIIENATFEVHAKTVDNGIGPYEVHGQCGFQRDYQTEVYKQPEFILKVYMNEGDQESIETSLTDATKGERVWASDDDGEQDYEAMLEWDRWPDGRYLLYFE